MGSRRVHHFPVLEAYTLDMSVYLTNINLLLDSFKEASSSFVWRFHSDSDLMSFNEIIGLDFIRHFDSLQLVPCLQGWAFSMPDGLVPFGEVDSFFYVTDRLSLKCSTSLPIQYSVKHPFNFM